MQFIILLILLFAFAELIMAYWYIIVPILILLSVFIYKEWCKYRKNKYSNIDYDGMDGHEFEYFCADLLKDNGYTMVRVTQGSADHGIDILANKGKTRYAIQCKCYTGNVGNKAIQEAYSGKDIYRCNVAVVMTNSYFTKQAISDAKKLNVLLWDRGEINRLIYTAKESIEGEEEQKELEMSLPQIHSDEQEKVIYKETIQEKKKEEVLKMYDKEKGIYPAGQYLVGRDIPLGGYILTSRQDKTAYVQLYPSYKKYKNEEDAIMYEDFTEDFHISLMEEETFLVVEHADIKRV